MAILKKRTIEEDDVAEVKKVDDVRLRTDGGDAAEVLHREASRGDWRRCLAEALTHMPPEMAQKFLQIVPREVLAEVLKSVEHPGVRLALMLLAK